MIFIRNRWIQMPVYGTGPDSPIAMSDFQQWASLRMAINEERKIERTMDSENG